jgi:23S rRNA pseudouridine2605 synthase
LEPSFKPRGPRKHISAMRAVEASAKGERKKAFQSETADRKGRAVVVERIAPAVQRRDPRQEDRQEDRRERTASPRAKRNEPATSGRRTERDERAGSKASFAGKGRKPGKPQAGLTDKAPVSRGPAKRPDGTDARNPASQRTSWTQRPVRGEKAGGIERPPRGGKPSRGDGPNKGGRPAAAKPNRPPRKH